jgi:diguanylate cyclase (GGDEF)-like protein/PAS domain S-box-containing protein
VFFDLDGTPLRMIGAVQDVTQQRRAEMAPASEPLGRILDSAQEAFVAMDAGGFISEWNRAAEKTFGWPRAQAIGRTLADLIIPAQFREAHWAGLRRFLETGQGRMLDSRRELSALHRDGREFPVELTISAQEIDRRWEFHAFVRDISDRKASEAERDTLIEKLDSLARTDELTGLWNRRAWDGELSRELARAARDEGHLCVAMLDLDGFKAYNDAHGHQAGDELLRAVGRSWRDQLRVTDVLARYGGEEFAVAFPAWPLDTALPVVERLRTDIPAGQTCSAGLVAWDGEESAEGLVGRADDALYEAKRAGRDRTLARS